MDYLVVGLGNPGSEYDNTRHNVGFQTIDVLGERYRATYWKHEAGSLTSKVTISASGAQGTGESAEVLLVKPLTFMNNSGTAVARLAKDHQVDPARIIVIHDELDLPEGVVRCKLDGGHAGHNGLRSITTKLQSSAYLRVRVGIGRPPGRMKAADYVLAPLRAQALESLLVSAQQAADVAESLVNQGLLATQNRYHTQPES